MPNSRLIKILGIILLFAVLVGGSIYLYTYKSVSQVDDDNIPSNAAMPSPVETQMPNRQLPDMTYEEVIDKAFAKWDEATSVGYILDLSDGDEYSINANMKVDLLEERVFATVERKTFYTPTGVTPGNSTYTETIIDGVVYTKYADGKTQTSKESSLGLYKLGLIRDDFYAYYDDKDGSSTIKLSDTTMQRANYDGKKVYHIKLNYNQNNSEANSGIEEWFTVNADVINDYPFTVELIVDGEMNIWELKGIPYVYGSSNYKFTEYNQEYDIQKPF